MERRVPRRAAVTAAVVLVATVVTACMPFNGKTEVIAFAGARDTQDLMGHITAIDEADPSYNPDPEELENISTVEPNPRTVPADDHCGAITYHTPAAVGERLPPVDSNTALTMLRRSDLAGDGCLDVARSSSPPRPIGQDLASFEYYAFGLQALGWSTGNPAAPGNLTIDQLRGIFDCTLVDWSQVGGAPGPIQRYWFPAGSETGALFQDEFLGFDPTVVSSPACPPVILTPEHTGLVIEANGHQASAIVPYWAHEWIANARGTILPDARGGQVMGSLDGEALVVFPDGVATMNTAGPVNEGNVELNDPTPAYPGIRYVFNVISSTMVNYSATLRFVGFENNTPDDSSLPTASPLCDGRHAAAIQAYGFGDLDRTISNDNLLGSTCRRFRP